MTWGANNKFDVKRVQNVLIKGQSGEYFGECSKANGKKAGNGVFFSKRILFLGGFVDGKVNRGHRSIVFNRKYYEL
jgi:hypothetical protein